MTSLAQDAARANIPADAKSADAQSMPRQVAESGLTSAELVDALVSVGRAAYFPPSPETAAARVRLARYFDLEDASRAMIHRLAVERIISEDDARRRNPAKPSPLSMAGLRAAWMAPVAGGSDDAVDGHATFEPTPEDRAEAARWSDARDRREARERRIAKGWTDEDQALHGAL